MTTWVIAAGLLLGGALMLLAALGLFRMPDLYTRMQTSTKAGTLGIGLLLAAVAVEFRTVDVATTSGLIVAFFLLTAPVAAQIIARAAYHAGVPLWKGTVHDELAEANPAAPRKDEATRDNGSGR